jgi:hypothetical protein
VTAGRMRADGDAEIAKSCHGLTLAQMDEECKGKI